MKSLVGVRGQSPRIVPPHQAEPSFNSGILALGAFYGYNSAMVGKQEHRVESVAPRSPAERIGVRPGDIVLSINGESLLDEIDYQYLTSGEWLRIDVDRNGQALALEGKKPEWESAGLSFSQSLLGPVRQCANRCAFCFIDQMPPGLRDSLYVKDDDWRRSLMYGTYITLTNVGEREFDRLLRRKPSPLYISVHATDPSVRAELLGNPNAGRIRQQLAALADAGIEFHSQIVLCPGVNDGEILLRTLADLDAMYPAARSVAIVPVGLTRFRQGLADIPAFTAEAAVELLRMIEPVRQECLARLGTRFAFASDEFYCLSGLPLPWEEEYEQYQQIENGVGLLRQFQMDFTFAIEDMGAPSDSHSLAIACGVSFAPFLRRLIEGSGIGCVSVHPVENRFFGASVTVSGLLTGSDLLPAIRGLAQDTVLITRSMLRAGEENIFLDDMTLDELCRLSGKTVIPIDPDGYALVEALHRYGGTV